MTSARAGERPNTAGPALNARIEVLRELELFTSLRVNMVIWLIEDVEWG